MNPSDRPTTPPNDNTTPTNIQTGSDQWILVALNNLTSEVRAIRVTADNIYVRLDKVERDILRATYVVVGALAVLGLLWGGFEVASRFVDIQITPK
jgi:hypothetical protein